MDKGLLDTMLQNSVVQMLQQDLYPECYDAYMSQYSSTGIPEAAAYDEAAKDAMAKKAEVFADILSKGIAAAVFTHLGASAGGGNTSK